MDIPFACGNRPALVLPNQAMNITVRRDALLSAHKRHVEGMKQGDAGALLPLFSDDIVLMPPNEPSIFGKAEAEEWFREYLQHFRVVNIATADRHVTLLGDGAVERWSYQIKIRPVAGGDPIRDEGRFLIVWVRGEEGWQITQYMWNSVQPVGAGTRRFLSLLKERNRARASRS
jgi:ketosteroid isomerase-like protein